MGDSGSDAGASIHASFRHLHSRAAAGSLRTTYKKRLFSRLLGRVRSFHGLYRPDPSVHTLP
jgi:hypothetical protein